MTAVFTVAAVAVFSVLTGAVVYEVTRRVEQHHRAHRRR